VAIDDPEAAALGFLKVLFGLLVVVVLAFWVPLLVDVAKHHPSVKAQESFGYLTAILGLLVFVGLMRFFGAKVKGLYVGADNRVSTSKVQVLLWTFAIGGVLLAAIAQSWAGLGDALKAISSSDFQYEPYLVLLGGPFLAAVAARGLVGNQVAEGKTAKPEGEPEPNQVFTDDEGNTDLVDTQYLLFNLIAIAFFIGAFVGSPRGGFPTIPTFLYVLTGASALGYVTNKAIPSGAPKITSLSPSRSTRGGTLTVIGSSLLFPTNPTGPSAGAAAFHPFEIQIDGETATVETNNQAVTSANGADRIKVHVPEGVEHTEDEEFDVVALNFLGQPSEPVKLKLSPG
jgi:cadmium resistance protein CadD (predicted permease)